MTPLLDLLIAAIAGIIIWFTWVEICWHEQIKQWRKESDHERNASPGTDKD